MSKRISKVMLCRLKQLIHGENDKFFIINSASKLADLSDAGFLFKNIGRPDTGLKILRPTIIVNNKMIYDDGILIQDRP
jgi:hypothetical protein